MAHGRAPARRRAGRRRGSCRPAKTCRFDKAPRAKTPAQLLADVNKLRKQQLGTRVLVDFVSKQTLASAFSANDLVAWKKAGVPEPVMQAALKRAP